MQSSYVFDKEQSYQSYHATTCHNLLANALCNSACLCLLEHSSTTTQKLSDLLCSAHANTSVITWYLTFLPALLLRPHGQAITSPITSVLATLHLWLSTMHYVCLYDIYDLNNAYINKKETHMCNSDICEEYNMCNSDICKDKNKIHTTHM